MTTASIRTRLATGMATLGLLLTGCAGVADSSDGLPTTDDRGAETADEPMTSGMCAEDEPDCEDTIVGDSETEAGAAGSCLAGDEDCTDESYGGQDVARPVLLSDGIEEETTTAERGSTSGATGATIERAVLVDDDTVRLVFVGSPCTLVEDVLVTESPAEVRVLVLTGQDATVEACQDEGLWLTIDLDLAEPLGDRTLLDLAG